MFCKIGVIESFSNLIKSDSYINKSDFFKKVSPALVFSC